MKPFTLLLLTLSLVGCASGPQRATPTELIAAPGATESYLTKADYDTTYRRVNEQMKSCFERKMGFTGTAQMSVISDKGAADARVSLIFTSMWGARAISATTLTPATAGTKVTIYTAHPKSAGMLMNQTKAWIDQGDTACPSAAPTEANS